MLDGLQAIKAMLNSLNSLSIVQPSIVIGYQLAFDLKDFPCLIRFSEP